MRIVKVPAKPEERDRAASVHLFFVNGFIRGERRAFAALGLLPEAAEGNRCGKVVAVGLESGIEFMSRSEKPKNFSDTTEIARIHPGWNRRTGGWRPCLTTRQELSRKNTPR